MNKTPKVLVVIVTYNRSDVTNIMLESVYRVKCHVAFDLFVVDNLSQPQEVDSIKNCFDNLSAQFNKNNIFIKNTVNSGYSAANNLGIKHAIENPNVYSHICLLNNDTIVTDFWLDKLVALDDGKSLIGPVSNSVGNEQRVIFDYDLSKPSPQIIDDINAYSQRWSEAHLQQVETSKMLGFFCVFASNSLFTDIGLLDEAFGIGMFEDDDFCQRCLAKGYRLLIAREVFIHHWGSATFSKIKKQNFYKMFDKNKAYWEAKHGREWQSYNTTTVDSLIHEISWSNRHPSQLSEQAAQNFEATVKYLVQSEYNLANIFNRGSLCDLLLTWEQNNIHASKSTKCFVLIMAYVFNLFPSFKKLQKFSFSDLKTRLLKLRSAADS